MSGSFDYPGSPEEIQKIYKNIGLKPGDVGFVSALYALREKEGSFAQISLLQSPLIRPGKITYILTEEGMREEIQQSEDFQAAMKILAQRVSNSWEEEILRETIRQEEERVRRQAEESVLTKKKLVDTLREFAPRAGGTVQISLENISSKRNEIKIQCKVLNCKNIRQDRTCGKMYSGIEMDEMGRCICDVLPRINPGASQDTHDPTIYVMS